MPADPTVPTAPLPTQMASAAQPAAPESAGVTDAPGEVAPPPLPDTAASGAPAPDAAGSTAEAPAAPPDPLAAAKKTLERARAGAQRNRQQREMQQRYEAQIAQERQARQEAERRAEKAAWLDSLRKLSPAERLAALSQEMGISSRDIAQQATREGTPEAALEALQQRVERAEQARRDLETRIDQERRQQQFTKVRQDFVTASRNMELYPNLASVNPDIVLDAAMATIHRLRQNPATSAYSYSDAEVLEFLNDSWTAPAPQPPVSRPKETQPPSGPAQTNGSATFRPLTNASSAKGYTLPKNFDDLDDLTQRKELAKALAASGLAGVNPESL